MYADTTLAPFQAVARRPPQFSFGLKHSPYLGKFRSTSQENVTIIK